MTRPVRKLAEDFGYKATSTTTIEKWLKKLEAEGAFNIEEVNVGKPKPQNIYILGERKGSTEVYYYPSAYVTLTNNSQKSSIW